MCFRPSAAIANETQIQTGTCPTCGQPVAANMGITSGTCPHCKEPIPLDSKKAGTEPIIGSSPTINPFN